MKKSLLTLFMLALGLAVNAQSTYFSQYVGTNTATTGINSGFASVKTTDGNFLTVKVSNAGGFEIHAYNSAGAMLQTQKIANTSCTIQSVNTLSEIATNSVLVTGLGTISSASVFYIAKINLATGDVTITTKVNELMSYTKGPKAVSSNGSIYAVFPQYGKFDLNKFDTDLNPLWSKTCEVDTVTGKNPGMDCEIKDSSIIIVGKCDTLLGWGDFDTTGYLDSFRLFQIEGYTRIYGMSKTMDGNMLLVGFNSDDISFGYTPYPVILKVSPSGTIIWAQKITVSIFSRFVDVTELPDGRIIAYSTTVDAYDDTYFNGAFLFDANGTFINSTLFGSNAATGFYYGLYDVKVYDNGLLMSGVVTDYTTGGTEKNIMVFCDFDFNTVCHKNNYPWVVTAALPVAGANTLTQTDIRYLNGTLPSTSMYGTLSAGSDVVADVCATATSVNESLQANVVIYPNPIVAGNNVSLTMNTVGSYTVNVISATGALVNTIIATGTTATIGTQNMTAGLYIVNVYENGVRISSNKIAVK